jgi:crotonobetainyl-CoA:carnitine CoA-transferase CaiB-like acyl-CoA transferase
VFRAADGDLVIAAQVDDAWKRFAALVETHGGPSGCGSDARFHRASGRNANRLEILAVVKGWVASRKVAEVLDLLDGIDVPCAKVQRIDEVLADPQIQARGMLVEQDHPVLGKIKLPNLPFRFSGCDTTIRQVAPDLGQHNAEIAAELGFSAEEIAAMQADGVLYTKEMGT